MRGASFLESAEVHGNSTGRPPSRSARRSPQGTCVILVIDVQGGCRSARRSPTPCSSSSRRPDLDVLEDRLRARGTDDEATIQRRLAERPARARAGQALRCSCDQRRPRPVRRRAGRDPDPEPLWRSERPMLEELKEEEIVNKVGGRFKLSTLIQKRMIALNQGARPLVDMRGVDKMAIVIQEIMQDKIYLDMSGNLQTNEPTEEARRRRDGRPYPAGRMSTAARRVPRDRAAAGPQGARALAGRSVRGGRDAPDATRVSRPAARRAGPGRDRAAPGGSDARPTATCAHGPALAFLLAERLPRAQPGGLRPRRRPRARPPSRPTIAPLPTRAGPSGATLAHVLVHSAGLVVVADPAGARRSLDILVVRRRRRARRLGPRARVRPGRRRSSAALIHKFAPGLRPSPPVGQRRLRRRAWPRRSSRASSARPGCS